jgi:DNA-binding LytR/AlgR family response regulator
LKPFDHERFQAALKRARERLRHGASHQHDSSLLCLLSEIGPRAEHLERVTIKADGRIAVVKAAEIDWVRAADN